MIDLDDAIRVGAVTVAALVNRSVRSGPSLPILFYGAKCPVAVLVHREGVTVAFEIDGAQIALDDLEQCFPGQRAAFERLATADTTTPRRQSSPDRGG